MSGDSDSGERRIRSIEKRVDDHDTKYGEIMSVVSRVEAVVESLEKHMARIDARQWDERPSAQMSIPQHPAPPSRTSVRPEFRQVGAMGAVVVLGQLVMELVRFIIAQPAQAVHIPPVHSTQQQEASK